MRAEPRSELAIDRQVQAVRARLADVEALARELGWSGFVVRAVCEEYRYDMASVRRVLQEGDRLTLGRDIVYRTTLYDGALQPTTSIKNP